MATLPGVIVSVESGDKSLSFLQPGKVMMGEIIDIYDPDERDSEEKKVDTIISEDSNDEGDVTLAGGILTPSIIQSIQSSLNNTNSTLSGQQILLQKQHELQTLHTQQTQKLIIKQQKDWNWFHSNHLNKERLIQLQNIHSKESMELYSRQQREQCELIHVIFKYYMPKSMKKKKVKVEDCMTQTDPVDLPQVDLANTNRPSAESASTDQAAIPPVGTCILSLRFMSTSCVHFQSGPLLIDFSFHPRYIMHTSNPPLSLHSNFIIYRSYRCCHPRTTTTSNGRVSNTR